LLGTDDLTVLVGFNPTCYSWNYETVHIDDQVLVLKYSPDGKLLAYWFDDELRSIPSIWFENLGCSRSHGQVPNALDIHICCKT